MTDNPENRTQIYYKKDEAFERQQTRLERWNGSERNKTLIRGFQQHLFAKGTGQYRTAKLTGYLRNLSDEAGKDLDTLGKCDIERLVAWINTKAGWGEHSRSDYRRTLKQFYRWFEDEDPSLWNGDHQARHDRLRLYKYLEKEVRSKPRPQSLDIASVITDEDRTHLLQRGCRTAMERAIISVLHETGCRVGELLNLRIRDFQRRGKYAWLRLDGKTGERTFPVLYSISHLTTWIAVHPHQDNPAALLWLSTHSTHYGQPMRYVGIKRLLERVFERAGWLTRENNNVVNKKRKCNPHWFRHSRASLLAPHVTEAILCKMMGWSIGSKQVRRYVHLCGTDVKDAFLKLHGLADTTKPQTQAQFCPTCEQTNSPEAKYCYKCGHALNLQQLAQDEEKKTAAIDEALDLLTKILADPVLKEKFEKYQKTSQ